MKKVLTLGCLLFSLTGFSQILIPRVGGTYIAVVEGFGAPGFSVGLEGYTAKRWSLSFDFNLAHSEERLAYGILVDRTYYNFDMDANYYFAEAGRGFYLSGGTFYMWRSVEASIESEEDQVPLFDRRKEYAGLNAGLGFAYNVGAVNLRIYSKLGFNFYDTDRGILQTGFSVGYRFPVAP